MGHQVKSIILYNIRARAYVYIVLYIFSINLKLYLPVLNKFAIVNIIYNEGKLLCAASFSGFILSLNTLRATNQNLYVCV